jgi:hypothetical protein
LRAPGVKPIALTGHPTAQEAVGLQLATLTTARGLPLQLFLGIESREQAWHIHQEGGEIWHCGPYAPLQELAGLVDRVLPGLTFEEIAPHVATTLADMLTKRNLTGEPA